MTYIGIDPNKNINRFLQVKPFSSYTEEAINNIKLLSFSRDKLATPFGSYIYRLQKYPGDLDLVEEFTECCSLENVINKFIKSLQNIVKNINRNRLHYFSEVKAGLDHRYDIDIGTMENGYYRPNKYLGDIIKKLHAKKLLSQEEYDIIIYILSDNYYGYSDGYDTIKYILRERKILRWTDEEILNGIKKLPGNKKITLKEALTHKADVKIDLISELNGKLVEITNYLQLAYEDKKGELHFVNIDLRKQNNIPLQLPKEIEKLYFSNMFYSPFKMVKRMYSLSRNRLDEESLKKIIPFVSSNTSLLYQIKSEIDTIILIIERLKSFPIKTIEKTLNDNKLRISTVLELSQEDILQINNLIDKINSLKNKYDKKIILKNLKKLIVGYINIQTISYLQKVSLNPPPNKYLPDIHTYNTNIVRGIYEITQNPFLKYQQIIENMHRGQGFPNFFESPYSSAILSKRIISNPGLNDIPKIDLLRRKLIDKELEERSTQQIIEGSGNKMTGWWALFNSKYQNYFREMPPITFNDFSKLFSNTKKFNFKVMLKKILDSIEFLEDPYIAPIKKHKKIIPIKQVQHPYIYPVNVYKSIPKGEFEEEYPEIIPQQQIEYPQIIPQEQMENSPYIIPQYQYTHPKIKKINVENENPAYIVPQYEYTHPKIKKINVENENPEYIVPQYRYTHPHIKKINVRNIDEEFMPEEIEESEEESQEEPYDENYENYLRELLDRCDNRVDKLIDTISKQQSYPQQYIQPSYPQQTFESQLENPPGAPRPPPPPGAPRPPPPPPPEEKLSEQEKQEMIMRREQKKKEVDIGKKISEGDLANLAAQAAIKRVERMAKQKILDEQEAAKKKLLAEQEAAAAVPVPVVAEGRIGGYYYAHNYKLPLYVNKNLKIPKLLQNEMHLYPQTASSYASDYYYRGYGPSLKSPNINNAPLVINGRIYTDMSRAGCNDCGLNIFRNIH
jgi:hypothetical protein